jgi:hypothetical protein
MLKCSVLTKDRTMMIDESYTLKEAMEYIESKGFEISLRRTLQLYGLKFVEERSFTTRYKSEFNLSDSKSMFDIKLKELRLYRDILTGHPVNRFR